MTNQLRLNLGSGQKSVPGWVCIDRSPNVLLSRVPLLKAVLHGIGVLSEAHMAGWDREIVRGDIRSLPYADSQVDAVYSSHALEHLYLDDAQKVLAEVYRILAPGRMLRLALPDATEIARRLLASVDEPRSGWRYNEELLSHPASRAGGIRALVGRAGGHVHRWQPTPSMVRQMLDESGFVDIRQRDYHEGDFPDLREVESRPASFFLEARKP